MPLQYETLIGHLFVVNGRTLSTAPPGSLVEIAPKKASRGREADTIFVLVLPSGTPTSAVFYEDLAKLAVERYFNSSGSVTAGLRAMYDTINRDLINRNRGGDRIYEVNMICGVLHDKNLILSRCGLGMAVLQQGTETTLFPTDPLNEDDLVFGPPLGVRPIPDVKMKQFTIAPGARLLLSDADLADAEIAALGGVMQSATLEVVLIELKALLIDQVTAIAAEFIPPEEPVDPFMREGSNSKEMIKAPLPPEKQIETVDIDPGFGTRLIDGATSFRDRTQDGLSQAARGVAKGAAVSGELVDHYFGEVENTKPRWWEGPVGVVIAMGIPLLVVALVIALWVTNIEVTEYELCVQNAFETANIARGIAPSDVNGTLAAWNAVLLKTDECVAIRPEGIPDQPMIDLQREGQNIVDRLLSIDRREAVPVASFPSARLSQIVLRGLTLYALDSANGIVYEVQLTDDGRTMQPNTMAPIPNMRQNAPVNQFELGEIIDIAWAEDGSALSQSNVLVALDRNGVLVEHSPTILTRGAQRLLGSENWVNPIAIQIWRGNLYVLDPGANQIWRYSPTGGSYAGAPTEYFAGQQRPNIANAVDFAIDNNGAVFVMLGNGLMGKYVSGEVQTFAFANFPPGQELGTADGIYLSTSPIAQSIYITSLANRTVFEVTQAGTFMRSYRAFDEEQFASVNAVTAEPGLQMVYVASGNSVFAFDREG